MTKMKSASTVTVAVLGACYTTCNLCLCASALQSSPPFPQTPRHNIAHNYLDEGHPYTIDPNNFHIGSSADLSEEMSVDAPNGMTRTVSANIETDVSRDYRYHLGSNPHGHHFDSHSPGQHFSSNPPGYHSNPGPLAEETVEVPVRPRRMILRRRSKLAPRTLGSSILSTRRKGRTPTAAASPDLLTFDEEKEIAEDIRYFRSVTRARDNLVEWMSREINRAGENQNSEPSEYQWASACSLSVFQLHEIMTRGQEARTKLIRGNVGLVTMIAKRYHNMLTYGGVGRSAGGGAGGTDATLQLDDLIQVGYMGIMEAAERFDPSKGFRFSTYATHWIRQRIVRAIGESSRMIRLPEHVQKTMRNMHKKIKEMEAQTGRPPSMPEVAYEMGLPLDKIHMYQHVSKNVLSLELPVDRHSNTEDKRTLGDRVACTEMATPDEDFMSESLRGEVHAMLDALSDNERMVLTHRFGLEDGRPKNIRETAEGMGVSSDIVRTVEAKALNKLRKPSMNYRLKDYVGGSKGVGAESEYAEQYHQGWAENSMANNIAEQQQQHPHYYHYPHHMNTAQFNTNDMARDDDLLEQKRPTPESMWSF